MEEKATKHKYVACEWNKDGDPVAFACVRCPIVVFDRAADHECEARAQTFAAKNGTMFTVINNNVRIHHPETGTVNIPLADMCEFALAKKEWKPISERDKHISLMATIIRASDGAAGEWQSTDRLIKEAREILSAVESQEGK